MQGHSEGDRAVTRLQREMNSIVESNNRMPQKILKLNIAFEKAATPFRRGGDGRIMSGMKNAAGAAVTQMVRAEIAQVPALPGEDIHDREARLKSILNEIAAIPWLAPEFKSTINMEITFAMAKLRYGEGHPGQ